MFDGRHVRWNTCSMERMFDRTHVRRNACSIKRMFDRTHVRMTVRCSIAGPESRAGMESSVGLDPMWLRYDQARRAKRSLFSLSRVRNTLGMGARAIECDFFWNNFSAHADGERRGLCRVGGYSAVVGHNSAVVGAEGCLESEGSTGKVSVRRVLRHLQVDVGPRCSPSACSEMLKKKWPRQFQRPLCYDSQYITGPKFERVRSSCFCRPVRGSQYSY